MDTETDTEINPWLLVACLLTAWVLIVVRVAVASHEELALLHPHAPLSWAAPLEMRSNDSQWNASFALN